MKPSIDSCLPADFNCDSCNTDGIEASIKIIRGHIDLYCSESTENFIANHNFLRLAICPHRQYIHKMNLSLAL